MTSGSCVVEVRSRGSSDPRDERLKPAAATVAKRAESWLIKGGFPEPDPKPTAGPGKPKERRASNP